MFKDSDTQLTNTCNSCHEATEFEFNVVKVPTTESFSNQEFKRTVQTKTTFGISKSRFLRFKK